MTPEQFCYWLQGMLECRSKNDHLSVDETQMIRAHLDTVFTNVTAKKKFSDETKESDKSLSKGPWSLFDDFFRDFHHSPRVC